MENSYSARHRNIGTQKYINHSIIIIIIIIWNILTTKYALLTICQKWCKLICPSKRKELLLHCSRLHQRWLQLISAITLFRTSRLSYHFMNAKRISEYYCYTIVLRRKIATFFRCSYICVEKYFALYLSSSRQSIT